MVHDATAAAGFAIEQDGVGAAEDSIPLAIYKPALLKDAEISLRLKPTAGKHDQGGGVAVRLMSPDDYYLVQVDALRNRVILLLVTTGVSEEIVGVDADIASRTWHTLAIRAEDDRFAVSFDGNWVFTGFDKTLSHPGRVALWTKGDSVTRFDSITITPFFRCRSKDTDVLHNETTRVRSGSDQSARTRIWGNQTQPRRGPENAQDALDDGFNLRGIIDLRRARAGTSTGKKSTTPLAGSPRCQVTCIATASRAPISR